MRIVRVFGFDDRHQMDNQFVTIKDGQKQSIGSSGALDLLNQERAGLFSDTIL